MAEETMCMRDLINEEFAKMVEVERARNPQGSDLQHWQSVLKSEAGRSLYARLTSSDGDLSPSEFLQVEKMRERRRKAGFETWDGYVATLAARLGAEQRKAEAAQRVAKGLGPLELSTDIPRGLELVAKRHPDIYREFIVEEYGAEEARRLGLE